MKKIFILAAAALTLAACENNEDNPDTTPVAINVYATIGEAPVSRAVNDSWEIGDRIGISSTVGTVVGPYINVEYKYTVKGTDSVFTGTKLYFYKPMTLTAYYPFTGVEGRAPGNDGIIDADTRPANQAPEKQTGIDFLWDSQTGFTAQDPNVFFKFAHKMSKVTFKFLNSDPVYDEETGLRLADGVDVSKMVSYKINNLVLDGTFNTVSGVCAVKPDAPAESLVMDVRNVKHDEDVLPVIIFPQTLSGGIATLDLYTDELNSPENLQHYVCSLSFSNGTINPGYHYKYTIKVTKIGLIVGKMTVEPWEEEYRFMTATIDGDNVFNEQK